MRYGNGEIRRCDASCYNAKSADCTCVCGGKNHGAGLQKAAENVRQYADELLEKLNRNNAIVTVDREADTCIQGQLL